MLHFTSWNRSSRREEGNPSSTRIPKGTFSLFKALTFHRRTKQNDEVSTGGKDKNPRINPPTANRPGAKLFALFSPSPRNPPPVPPKALKSSPLSFFSTNEAAEYCNSPVNLGGRGTPNPNSSKRHRASQRNPTEGQQTQSELKPSISQQILSSTQPFRDVEPLVTYDNRARATIVHRRQNARTISRMDVALARAKGPIPAKNIPIGMHGRAEDAKGDASAKGSVLLSQSDRLQSAGPLSQKPTALKAEDWSNNPKLFPVNHPVVTLCVYDGAISSGGAAEQGPSDLQPQNEDTPRLETGPSVMSFVALRSRSPSSTGSDSEEEASESHQPVAAKQGDEEPVSSRPGLPGHAGLEATGDQRSISHRPENSIATSTESGRTVRPRHARNPAVGLQALRRVNPPPHRALPPPPSSKHAEVERTEPQGDLTVQPGSSNQSGSSAERAEGQAARTNHRYSAHYRSPGVVVDVSSGRPFNVAETEGQLRFYAMVGSRQLYHATAMSARAYGYVVGPDHSLRRAPVSNDTDVSSV
ncbi:hypothetical protein FRC04_001202 [Tulasnella sp. 424]|nr:hypothetical protein FRC04_001202 [Tulasnella sp. 424]KAG8975778.1 hypothetical protein FRC05_004988 [Tulasnella sp. 425]